MDPRSGMRQPRSAPHPAGEPGLCHAESVRYGMTVRWRPAVESDAERVMTLPIPAAARHSLLMATSGSTFVARRPGSQLANTETAIRNATTDPMVAGSNGVTP
jgi:hypothetical protein